MFAKKVALVALTAGIALAGAGCEKTRDELQPDMDRVRAGDHGPQCANLREMATIMAPKVLACRDIAQNPNRITVAMLHMDNKTEDMRGRDLDIYVARLSGLLQSAEASDRVLFVETAKDLAQLQADALGGVPRDPYGDAGRTTPAPTGQIPAQFALHGTVYSMVQGRTNYYLFQFKLTNLVTGGVSWSDQYDVRTLN
jgi:hypothetical protein